jgi:hypothetical protein
MSQVFDDIFFIIYILYYVDQISDLEVRVGLINWEGESNEYAWQVWVVRCLKNMGSLVSEWSVTQQSIESTFQWKSALRPAIDGNDRSIDRIEDVGVPAAGVQSITTIDWFHQGRDICNLLFE